MLQSRKLLGGAAATLLFVAMAAWAAETPSEGKVIEDKRATITPATTVDFAKELGLNFPTLQGLGARIESARAAADPVGLASAARELQAAEKVAGKTAAIKSEDLIKEAVASAKLRNISAELKVVAALLADDPAVKDFNDLAAKAAQTEANLKAAKESGAKPRGIQNRLIVDNHTDKYLAIYVDGRYVGRVDPWGNAWMNVGQGAYETTYLDARDGLGGVWQHQVPTPTTDFTWRLYP